MRRERESFVYSGKRKERERDREKERCSSSSSVCTGFELRHMNRRKQMIKKRRDEQQRKRMERRRLPTRVVLYNCWLLLLPLPFAIIHQKRKAKRNPPKELAAPVAVPDRYWKPKRRQSRNRRRIENIHQSPILPSPGAKIKLQRLLGITNVARKKRKNSVDRPIDLCGSRRRRRRRRRRKWKKTMRDRTIWELIIWWVAGEFIRCAPTLIGRRRSRSQTRNSHALSLFYQSSSSSSTRSICSRKRRKSAWIIQ